MTPHVLVDPARVRRNIDAMADFAAESGLSLRPHVKTHKISEIARLQIGAGAEGLTVATIGEAEVFDFAGDLFIAYPLWPTAESVRRLARLRSRVRVGVDSVEAVREWQRLAVPEHVQFMVELDSGHHRSGTVDPVPVAQAAGSRLAGLFTFPGHSYAPGAQKSAAADEWRVLGDALRMIGGDLVLSGGSTPSAKHSASGVDEIRPGVYVFNDAQQLELGTCTEEEIALVVRATVVSRREDLGQVILDSGSKILGSDRPSWATGFARIRGDADARVIALSEHHATVTFPGELPALGERLDVIPNHVCPVLNLVDEVQLVGGGTWTMAARGRKG